MPFPLMCPLCRAPLLRDENTWRCAARHSFDVAREGYVNLLPVQNRKSLAPGDNPDMVRARRDFLAAGHYAPLRDAITALLTPLACRRAVDLGCGEGYYSAAIADALVPGGEFAGVDIARPAVQLAARRYPQHTWLVASSASVPLADACCDLVASLFAPLPAAEMARLLPADGLLLVATPDADHLATLRAALFDEVRAHEPEKLLEGLAPQFSLRETRRVRFPLALDADALAQLLLMTPYGWRAKAERREALLARGGLADEAAFSLFLLGRV